MQTPAPSPASRSVVLVISLMFATVAACGAVATLVLLAFSYGWNFVGLFLAVLVGLAGTAVFAWRRTHS